MVGIIGGGAAVKATRLGPESPVSPPTPVSTMPGCKAEKRHLNSRQVVSSPIFGKVNHWIRRNS